MLNLCLNYNESQPIYACKRYSYKKRVYLHSLQIQAILIVSFISLIFRSRNVSLLFKKNRRRFFQKPFKIFLGKKLAKKKVQQLRNKFRTLFVENSWNKLLFLPKIDYK